MGETEVSLYIEGKMICWWCGKVTRVYTWRGHELWSKVCPDYGRPDTLKLCTTSNGAVTYWANHCEHCGRLQGDWFVYMEPQPGGAFVFGSS